MKLFRKSSGRGGKPVPDLASAARGQVTASPSASLDWPAQSPDQHQKSPNYERHRAEIDRGTAGQTGSDRGFTLSSMRRGYGSKENFGSSMTPDEHSAADAWEAQQGRTRDVQRQQSNERSEKNSEEARAKAKARERSGSGPTGYDPYATSDTGHI